MTKLKPAIRWFGGKQLMSNKLLPLFPEHHTYVEPFGGAGALLFGKEPSPVEIYNDRDSNLVNFMRVLRDRGMFPDFYNRACMSPYSREEWLFCANHLNDDPDPVERARRFFVVARFSFGGLGKSFGIEVTASSRGMVQSASAFQSVISVLPRLSERLVSVLIENRDFRDIIRVYDTEQSFFYLDPPYLPETRKLGSYKCEMTAKDHCELVELLRNIKGKAMLSGYPNSLYDSLDWNKQEWAVCCKVAGRTRATGLQGTGSVLRSQKRTECIWMNY